MDKHQATPDQTGKLFDNPQVEQTDDEYFNLMGYFF